MDRKTKNRYKTLQSFSSYRLKKLIIDLEDEVIKLQTELYEERNKE